MPTEVKYYVEKGVPVAKVIIKKGLKGFPLLGILQIIFVIAKIFDKLDWNWFLVFWPIWIIPGIFFGAIALVGVFCLLLLGIAWLLDMTTDLKWWWKRKKSERKERDD